ncbi:alpha/beta fold hydrolase [Azospirillum sp. B510]|uniref:alpha/beta fold hydrolase n=1 Tax=Azospirillum sp. (strain B510) TaxID=137722 RepID=UPI0005A80272|nr:alpha/beta hydrolase [Azospirillum sp. B510]
MKASRSEFIEVLGIPIHIRRWGEKGQPTIFLLHGWQDASATFQFMVDGFTRHFNIIAPDWHGFGLSAWGSGFYHLSDYAACLDAILDAYSPDRPAMLVGHSMGGNVSGLYAGARPERVAKWVNMEGYAPVPGYGGRSPAKVLSRWLRHRNPREEDTFFESQSAVNEEFSRLYPRLSDDRRAFLIEHLTVERAEGRWAYRSDPRARVITALPLAADQVKDIWSNVTADTLCLRGARSFVTSAFAEHPADLAERLGTLRRGREIVIEDAGHNMHHDQPLQVAALIEAFLTGSL